MTSCPYRRFPGIRPVRNREVKDEPQIKDHEFRGSFAEGVSTRVRKSDETAEAFDYGDAPPGLSRSELLLVVTHSAA